MRIGSLCTAKFTNSYIQKKNKNNEISVNQPALNFKANTLAIRKNNLLKNLLFTVGLLLTSIVPSESNKNRNSELLTSAIVNNDINTVKLLCKYGNIDINRLDAHGFTALTEAVYMERKEIFQELLKHEKIDPYLKDNDGKTAMDINSEVKNIVQKMEDGISREAYEKLNIQDADLYNTSAYLKILNSEITPNGLAILFNRKQNNGQDSLLCKLASYPMIDENNENEFKEILSKIDKLYINYNQKDENGISVFEYVLNSENKIFLEFLIKKGAKFDYYSNLDNRYEQITDKDFKTLLDAHKYELVDFKDVRDAIKSGNTEAKKAIEPQTKSPFFYSPDYMYIL